MRGGAEGKDRGWEDVGGLTVYRGEADGGGGFIDCVKKKCPTESILRSNASTN